MRALEDQGYEQPTRIQARAIPPLLAGRDVLGQAQTGTGKTAAFALPLLQRLDPAAKHVQAIVLTPTRELALQVAVAVRAYGRRLGERGVHVLPVYGGQPISVQLRALVRGGVHVVIGTPGRVRDHLERRSLDLSRVSFFGLDEADEMLNMGFLEDVEWILEHAPADRQIAFFSATLPPPIRRVADTYLNAPEDVKVKERTLTVPNIEQLSLRVSRPAKLSALERLLEVEEHEAILIFTRTQKTTAELAEQLEAHGHAAECIHGGMNQSQREAVVRRLRARSTQIVVATDVAARGLDVDHIGLVVNYDLPRDQEIYVHRVGRTARAGRSGRAITFWQPRERRLLQSIERFSGQVMQPMRIPGRAEILDRRRIRFAERVREAAANDPSEFVEMVESIALESGLSLAQVAAATAKMVWGEGPLKAPPEPEPMERAKGGPGGEFYRPMGPADGEVELVFPVGRWNKVRPGDILQAIDHAAQLSGDRVGNIRILDKVSFVSVPRAEAPGVLEKLEGAQICGRFVRPRLAHPEQDGDIALPPSRHRGGGDRGARQGTPGRWEGQRRDERRGEPFARPERRYPEGGDQRREPTGGRGRDGSSAQRGRPASSRDRGAFERRDAEAPPLEKRRPEISVSSTSRTESTSRSASPRPAAGERAEGESPAFRSARPPVSSEGRPDSATGGAAAGWEEKRERDDGDRRPTRRGSFPQKGKRTRPGTGRSGRDGSEDRGERKRKVSRDRPGRDSGSRSFDSRDDSWPKRQKKVHRKGPKPGRGSHGPGGEEPDAGATETAHSKRPSRDPRARRIRKPRSAEQDAEHEKRDGD